LKDASWNEKIASVLLIVAILAIGIAPFWLYNLIAPDAQFIMENIARVVK
jgi:NADH:ubiquinone oxidoreductase subunit 4 (subunit M)